MIKGAIVKTQAGDRVRIVGPSSAPDLWWAELPDDEGNFSGRGEGRGDLTLIDRGDLTVALWRICTAPPGGCGMGPRRRVLTEEAICGCGSSMRVAKNQKGSET